MESIAAYITNRFQTLQLPGKIYWDPEVPRSDHGFGLIIFRHLAFDVHLRLRLAVLRTGRLVEATAVQDLILYRDKKTFLHRLGIASGINLVLCLILAVSIGLMSERESLAAGLIGLLVTYVGFIVAHSWLKNRNFSLPTIGEQAFNGFIAFMLAGMFSMLDLGLLGFIIPLFFLTTVINTFKQRFPANYQGIEHNIAANWNALDDLLQKWT